MSSQNQLVRGSDSSASFRRATIMGFYMLALCLSSWLWLQPIRIVPDH